jgi:hypothetical protein
MLLLKQYKLGGRYFCLRQSGTFPVWRAVLSRYARQNCTQKIDKYHAAVGNPDATRPVRK